jgi:hypothetical protein
MPVRHLIFLATTVSLAGCFLSTEPTDSLLLDVTVEPTIFRIGDTASIITSIRNPTRDTIRYYTDGCDGYTFSVTDADGREVAPVSVGCHGPTARALAPGEEIRDRILWFGEPVSLARPHGQPYPVQYLPPGTYAVRAVLPLESGRRRSAPVTVELLPAQ